MKFIDAAQLFAVYRGQSVNTQIHPNDRMFNTNPDTDGYDFVGVSAIEVIVASLALSTRRSVWRILDFGCGYGRVARHLRACFQSSEITFVDIIEEAAEFCARQFDGNFYVSDSDYNFSGAHGFDLIWVGSVFTHIDFKRMQTLFSILSSKLSKKGILVGTFRGKHMYNITKQRPKEAEDYAELLAQFDTQGHGYQSYGRKDLGDWGLSLITAARISQLSDSTEFRQIMFSEAAWANVHDVSAWQRRA